MIIEKLAKKFGVEVELSTPKVPYKETIKGSSNKEGKYKNKAVGGASMAMSLEIKPLNGARALFLKIKL